MRSRFSTRIDIISKSDYSPDVAESMKAFSIVPIFLTLQVWAAASPTLPNQGSAKQAMTEFNQGEAVLLDVRENEEVARGRVRGALVFPKSKIGTPEWDRFVGSLDKEKVIYTYCRSGRRSDAVAAELRKRGFRSQNAGGLTELQSVGAITQ